MRTSDGGRFIHERRTRRLGALVAAALVLLAACSGGDGEARTTTVTRPGGETLPTRPPTTTTVAPTTTQPVVEQSSSTTTTTVELPPSTTTPPAVEAVRTPLRGPSLEGSSYELAELVGPYVGGTPMLLVADRRDTLGAPRQLVIYRSNDGRDWSEIPGLSLGTDADTDITAATWTGNRFAVGGSVPGTEGGRVPQVWFTTDLASFSIAEDPFDGRPGVVTELAASIEGLVVLGQVYDGTTATTMISLRDDVTGEWTLTELPPGAKATGLAANGGSVSATGSVTSGQLQQAAAWASVDGGRTFTPADTSPFAGAVSTAIGAVVAYPAGFVGVACVGNGDGATTAVATTNDGFTWERLELDVVYANEDDRPYPNQGSSCNRISFGADRFYIGGYDVDAVLLAIRPDGVGHALRFPLDEQTVATGEPVAALAPDGSWVAVAPTGRGLLGVVEDPATYLVETTGLPRAGRTVFPPRFSRGANGIAAAVSTYPDISANADGFTWGPLNEWFVSRDGGSWSPSPFLNDLNAVGTVSNGTTTVAWSSVDDPADDGRPGPTGGIGISAQHPDGTIFDAGVVASGLGGQAITAIEPVPTGYVAVGYSEVRDLDTGRTPVSPIVHVAPPDGRAWSQETLPDLGGDAVLDGACVLGDGTLLALGQGIVDGAATLHLLRRTPDAAWTRVDPAPFGGIVRFDSCTASDAGAVLVATVDDTARAFFTADGVTFDEADFADAAGDDTVTAFASYPRGFVAIGETHADADADIVVWHSADGVEWRRQDVAGLGGPGDQVPGDVIVIGTRLVIGGISDGAPMVWAAPLP